VREVESSSAYNHVVLAGVGDYLRLRSVSCWTVDELGVIGTYHCVECEDKRREDGGRRVRRGESDDDGMFF